jgi:hypothetical protein
MSNEVSLQVREREAMPVIGRSGSDELRRRIDVAVSPRAYQVDFRAPSLELIAEARALLELVGPVRTIGLVDFQDWVRPFFAAAGSRAVSPDDRLKQTAALWDLVADLPAEVFTPEARRAVAKISEFVPTAARINQVVGARASKIAESYQALARIASAVPPAPPLPPKTPEERQKDADGVEAALLRLKTDAAVRASAGSSRPALRDVSMSADEAAVWRNNNPLVAAARAASQSSN